jgi:hypothetical protein
MVSEALGGAVSPERLFLDSPPQALPLSLLFEWVERPEARPGSATLSNANGRAHP